MNLKKTLLVLMGPGSVALLIMLLDPVQVSFILTRVTPLDLVLLFSLQLLTLAAGAWIWHFLISRRTRISYVSVLLINQASSLVEALTPSVKLGGEAAKIFLLRKKTDSPYHVLAGIMLVQKFLTMIPFALFFLAMTLPALFILDIPGSFALLGAGLTLACLGLAWICYGRAEIRSASHDPQQGQRQNKIHRTGISGRMQALSHKAFTFMARARTSASGLLTAGQTLNALSVSLGVWVLYPVKVYLACHFLGLEVGLLMAGLATLFAYTVSMLPLLPGGLGAYEGGMTAVLCLAGLSPAEGLAVSLLTRLTTFWFPLALSALACAVLFWRDNPMAQDMAGTWNRNKAAWD